jgi:glutamate-1-semialdehyde 2,1-aminomutase
VIDRGRLRALLERERAAFVERHPRSRDAYRQGGRSLLGNVPMTWMNKAAGGFPVYLAEAAGASVTDIDGHRYADFSLGDTGAMAGHSPAPTVAAVRRRYAEAGGATAMLPTTDAAWVGAELARRFGVPLWSFTLTATDANRWALRLARLVTGRPKVLVCNYCYHGTVDEAFVTLGEHGPVSRAGNVGPPVDPTLTTRVVEFNDLDGLAAELAAGDVACVLMEPALTNIGIVLPLPGYLDGVRELTRRHGTLLVNDETHTVSAGPGGCTRAWGLEPDLVTVGKAIGGGVPAAAFGVSAAVAERVAGRRERRPGRHRRRGRDAGGQRAVGGGDARDPGAGPDRRGVRRHDRAGDPLHRGRGGRAGRPAAAVVGGAAGGADRVPLCLAAAGERGPVGRGRRRRAGRLPPPVPPQPRHPDDPVPQHGVDVPGDHDR